MSRDPLQRQAPAGKTGIDPASAQNPEDSLRLPWGIAPESSWLDYRCWLETELDPGMALHKPLPQEASEPDTLALVSAQDARLDVTLPRQGGVNLRSHAPVVDVIQRMATSTYRFVLRGWGLRAGYQVPIPGLVSVGGIPAVPVYPQRAYNTIVGNCGGVPVWFAPWELHYILGQTPAPARAEVPVPYNPTLHVRPDAQLPRDIALPQTWPDQADQPGRVAPPIGGFIQGK